MFTRFKKSDNEMITTKRFKIKRDRKKYLIDTILKYFKQNLTKNQYPLRWSISKAGKNTIILETNILDLKKIKVSK
ncbi:MAG: hypothetical protein J7J93_00200 [Candidatus Aenigmarchaeota archaeon]|nr:hypothetical protein [Candidatus Aenigmarchaeota archaeon]